MFLHNLYQRRVSCKFQSQFFFHTTIQIIITVGPTTRRSTNWATRENNLNAQQAWISKQAVLASTQHRRPNLSEIQAPMHSSPARGTQQKKSPIKTSNSPFCTLQQWGAKQTMFNQQKSESTKGWQQNTVLPCQYVPNVALYIHVI
jgi:hypothetical protein